MLVKALRRKDTKEFIHPIETNLNYIEMFTGEYPDIIFGDATFETLKDYYTERHPHIPFNEYELVEFELTVKQRILKIDLGGVPEEEIEEYIRRAIEYNKSGEYIPMVDAENNNVINYNPDMIGRRIIAFGQEADVIAIDKDYTEPHYMLNHPIVVTTADYTRDYVYLDEIKEYL